MSEVLNDSANYWLSIALKQSQIDKLSPRFAYIYSGLIIATVFADILRTNYYFTIVLHGSNRLHNNMLRGLLYTSVQFFESNPSGRILNRASKDQHIIDELLPVILFNGIRSLLIAAGSIFIICFINLSLLFLLIVLVPFVWLIIRFYQRSSRQLKRLENITRSPVYALFSSSLNGLSTIRAFKAENSFIQLVSDRIDANTSAYIFVHAASQWFSIRLNVACSLILLITSFQIVFFRNEIDFAAAALSLMSAMYVSLWFQWAVRQFSEADTLMTSGERINEYVHLPREEDEGGYKRLVKTSPKWPTHGIIEFRNYSLRHRFNLEYAIRNINLRIESGQKIGIIGRTGTY
jgi:ABC-type multidrug transport system fused ATPase/permease subunit